MSTWTTLYLKGQGHLVTLALGLSDFSLETAGPLEVKFHVKPAQDKSMNFW